MASLPFRLITHNTHWQDKPVKYKGIYIYDHNYFLNNFKHSLISDTWNPGRDHDNEKTKSEKEMTNYITSVMLKYR